MKNIKRPGPSKILRRCASLLPALARRGAAPPEALAAAYITVYLFYSSKRPPFIFSPKQLLSSYGISEIARLCAQILDEEETG